MSHRAEVTDTVSVPGFDAPGKAPLILVVDDDPAIRLLVRHVLTEAGFRIAEAEDGHTALTRFSELRPDLLILDALVPGLDGFEICARVRQLPYGLHVPVLMVTGINDTVAVARAYQSGATDFLPNKHENWILLEHRVRYLLRAGEMLCALQHSESQRRILSLAIEQSPTSIVITDADANIEYVNPRFCEITNYERSEVIGKNVRLLKHPDTHSAVHRDMWQTLIGGGIWRGEICNCRKDGQAYWVSLITSPIYGTHLGKSKIEHFLSIQEDVTTRRTQEIRIRHLSYFDPTTGLPNRRSLRERLGQILSHVAYPQTLTALLLLDLDHFNRINDTFGHRVGDQLLQEVTFRFSELLNKTKNVAYLDEDRIHTVARIGGDEFAIVLIEAINADRMAQIAQQWLDALSRPFLLEGTDVICSASIGIAVHPVDGSDVDTLWKSADTALYTAKNSGRNTHRFYSHAANESGMRRMRLESQLHRALERKELVLYYQPQLQLQGEERIVGFEALIRWNNAEMGLISPLEFIPIAEDNDLIIPIGNWVLETACRAAAAWQVYGDLRVAVNLSARQLRHRSLLETVTQALESSKLPPHCLELEITESVIMQDAATTARLLTELKAVGLHLAIDDFGTGYSSLSYLKTFPIDTLKVDRSFVMDVGTSTESTHIVAAIIAMGHGLGLQVVAEGVEEKHQLEFLRGQGCDLIQGYLIGRPLPAAEFQTFLERCRT